MWYGADYEIKNPVGPRSEWMFWSEVFFLIVYSGEFACKIWRFGWHGFFVDDVNFRFNWLDFLLILLSVYSIFLSEHLPNVAFLRMLKLLRLAKAVRVLKLIQSVKQLRAMLKSLVGTVATLCWSLVMIAVILFLLSLIFVLRVSNFFA